MATSEHLDILMHSEEFIDFCVSPDEYGIPRKFWNGLDLILMKGIDQGFN